MKRRFNETIDGSIKNIIQLKTVNNSLEWSQMYDALEDCPVEFINKLIQTLNSLGETMGVEPTQTFDKVLCNVNDDNEETRKKLYNWWRGVFEVLGSCKNSIPKDKEDEFNEKVDALMAEIMKAGDSEATDEEEPVMESSKPRFEKGRVVFTRKGGHRGMVVKCSKEDGRYFYTIAWMGSEHGFAEFWEDELCLKSELTMENYEQETKGDYEEEIVSERSLSFAEKYGVKKGDPVEVWLDCMGKGSWARGFTYVCGGSYGEYVWVTDGRGKYEMPVDCVRPIEYVNEEYEPADKEDETNMLADMKWAVGKIGEIANRVQELINFVNPYCEVNESLMNSTEYATSDDLELMNGFEKEDKSKMKREKTIWKEIRQTSQDDWVDAGEVFEMAKESDEGEEFWKAMDDVDDLERKGYWSGKFKVGDKVNWIGPDEGYPSDGWTIEDVTSGEHPSGDDLYIISRGKSSVMNIRGSELRPAKMAKESDLENELDRGDDGWVEIGQPVGEATVIVDANDVWNVLKLLDDEQAKKNLTDLINSHVRTEEEIMDAINSFVNSIWGQTVTKSNLNKALSKWMKGIVSALGLDEKRYKETGEFEDSDKPTSVKLESGATKKVSLYVDWDDDGAGLDSNVVIDVPVEIADSEESTALYDYITDWIDHQDFCVNDWAITDIEGLSEISENNDEVKSADVKDGEKQVTQDGETKTLVAGEEGEKKPVCEMTIEQEIDDPWKLSELLWSQGKENLEELLRSELVGEEDIMQMLEDTGVRNLTNINDLFAFDFPSVLDSLGLDGEAWSQNLEIKRKGDDDTGDDGSEGDGDNEMVDWLKTKLEKLPDEVFDKKKKK